LCGAAKGVERRFSKATKQVVNFADASVRAATANAAHAAKGTTKGKRAN